MKISVSQAAKDWGISRTTIYKSIDAGKLSRGPDKKIDTTEMLRVFGNPPNKKRTEQTNKNVHETPVNNQSEQWNVQLEYELEIEKLKNTHLQQQLEHYKQLIENYQKQIEQLSKSLDKANSSIQDFAQTKLLEMERNLLVRNEHQTKSDTADIQQASETLQPKLNTEANPSSTREKANDKKKSWWPF